MLEASKVKQYPFQANQLADKSDWEEFIIQIAKEIAEDQSPKRFGNACHVLTVIFRLLAIRGKLYELLSHCIPPEVILKVTQCRNANLCE